MVGHRPDRRTDGAVHRLSGRPAGRHPRAVHRLLRRHAAEPGRHRLTDPFRGGPLPAGEPGALSVTCSSALSLCSWAASPRPSASRLLPAWPFGTAFRAGCRIARCAGGSDGTVAVQVERAPFSPWVGPGRMRRSWRVRDALTMQSLSARTSPLRVTITGVRPASPGGRRRIRVGPARHSRPPPQCRCRQCHRQTGGSHHTGAENDQLHSRPPSIDFWCESTWPNSKAWPTRELVPPTSRWCTAHGHTIGAGLFGTGVHRYIDCNQQVQITGRPRVERPDRPAASARA